MRKVESSGESHLVDVANKKKATRRCMHDDDANVGSVHSERERRQSPEC